MRRVFAVIGVVFVLAFTLSIPLMALDVRVVSIRLMDFNLFNSLYVVRSTGQTTTTSTYAQGDSIILDDLISCTITVRPTNQATTQGYTGAYVYLTASGNTPVYGYLDTPNLIGQFTNLLPNYENKYYVDFNNPIDLIVSMSEGYDLWILPAVYSSDTDLAYSAGERDGYRRAQSQYSSQIYQLQAQVSRLTSELDQALQDADLSDAYEAGYVAGYEKADKQPDYVREVFVSTANATGSIFQQFFELEVLGIKVYAILLMAVIIPLFIFVLKAVMHHGG